MKKGMIIGIITIILILLSFILWFLLIRIPPEIKKCLEIEYYMDRYDCISEESLKLQDPSYCKKIEITNQRMKCIQQIEIDISMCDDYYAHSERAGCLLAIAELTNNIEICKRELKGDSDVHTFNYNCVIMFAYPQKNKALCDHIITDSFKKSCKDEITIMIVKENNNTSLCGEVISNVRRNDCISGHY